MSEEIIENKAAEDQEKPVAVDEKAPDPEVSEAGRHIASLETSLNEKTTELSEAKKMLDAQAADIASLKAAGEEAVTAYKKLAVSSNPLFSGDVITGATIAEVDASMARVTDLAGKIKTKVEAEIKATIVPAGAPERSGPDTSGLSPREKIKQGLEENKK